jgi:cardiolipin synthase A/B
MIAAEGSRLGAIATRAKTRARAWGRGRARRIVAVCIIVALGLGLVVGLAFLRWRQRDRPTFRLTSETSSAGPEFALALYQSVGARLQPGHEVALVANGTVFDAIEREIRAAKVSVHFDVFIWQKGVASDRLTAALTHRNAGVACRVLVDDVGSTDFDTDVRPALVAAGCDVRVFRPVAAGKLVARNHRKIVVVDGRVAVTGGFGIQDQWLGDGRTDGGWRDANVRFSGPAVAEAQRAIAENWQEAGGPLFPPDAFPPAEAGGPFLAAFVTSTSSDVVTPAQRLVQLTMQAASKRLWIANSYFVPPRPILDLLKAKAAGGVDVRLLVPGTKSDSKISVGSQHVEYGSLVASGVRVFEYQPSMMHAKTMLVDEALSIVGSINLEPLSLGKLEESALVVHDPVFAEAMARSFEGDCLQARPVDD